MTCSPLEAIAPAMKYRVQARFFTSTRDASQLDVLL